MSGRPVAIDLFCGVGGLSLGLEQSGFEVAAAVERDGLAGRYAQFNHPNCTVYYGPEEGEVASFLSQAVLTRFKGLDLVAGGPPCQGFSEAGLRATEDPRNDGIGLFVDVVSRLEPRAFLMENVPGILSRGTAQLSALNRQLRATYCISAPTILVASDFGIPQARRRVFVIGIHRDLGEQPTFPDPLEGAAVSAWDALADVPVLRDPRSATKPVPYEGKPTSLYARRLRGLEEDPADKARGVEWNSTLCFNVAATRHGDAVLKRFSRLGFGDVDAVSRLRRIDPHGLSPTIRAGTRPEHGSRSAPRPIHPYNDRVLTPRECARIQSFPDWYVFHPALWHGNMQIGNAVPPLLARAIGAHLIRMLGYQPRRARSTQIRDASLIEGDFGDDAPKLSVPWVARES